MTTTTTTDTPQYLKEMMTTGREQTEFASITPFTWNTDYRDFFIYFIVILALSVDYMGLCAISFITERYNGKYKIKIKYE